MEPYGTLLGPRAILAVSPRACVTGSALAHVLAHGGLRLGSCHRAAEGPWPGLWAVVDEGVSAVAAALRCVVLIAGIFSTSPVLTPGF